VYHQQTAPEGGAIGLARDRLRLLRMQHRNSDRIVALANDTYAKFLKPQQLEGYLLKQTRNPRRDAKYKDKVWKKRWVVLDGMLAVHDSTIMSFDAILMNFGATSSDDAFYYYKDTEITDEANPQGIVPLYLVTGVRTASRFGTDSFEIDAGGRSFYFKVRLFPRRQLPLVLMNGALIPTLCFFFFF
jgi:hypothetical protein